MPEHDGRGSSCAHGSGSPPHSARPGEQPHLNHRSGEYLGLPRFRVRARAREATAALVPAGART
jgi:hypothetical protein